mgnify:CR=1 FL=1
MIQNLDMETLRHFDVSHNVLNGIPAPLLDKATQLRVLNLRGNKVHLFECRVQSIPAQWNNVCILYRSDTSGYS